MKRTVAFCITLIVAVEASAFGIEFHIQEEKLLSISFTEDIVINSENSTTGSTGITLILNSVYSSDTLVPGNVGLIDSRHLNGPQAILRDTSFSRASITLPLRDTFTLSAEDISMGIDKTDLLVYYSFDPFDSQNPLSSMQIGDEIRLEAGSIFTPSLAFDTPAPDNLGSTLEMNVVASEYPVILQENFELDVSIIPEPSSALWVGLFSILTAQILRPRTQT